MEPIRIGSTVPAEKIHHIIEKFPLKKKININYEDHKDRYVYAFALTEKKIDEEMALYNILADFIQRIILEFYSKKFIKHRILETLVDVKGLDNASVLEAIYDMINDDKELQMEKKYMNDEILDYIIENNVLIIDGYLAFRPMALNYVIDKAMDKIVEDIQLEIEYNEFIYMLQYFVDTQYPKIDLVNVIINKDDFQIKDSLNIPINNDFIKLTLEELFEEDISQSDILLSSLLALAPLKIVIHVQYGREDNLLNTLKRIFRDRIRICHGCNSCDMDIIEDKIDKS